jgi:hypothetical protein
MWAYKGKLLTARYLPHGRKDFIKRALMLQDADVPMVLHFRWATHGAVTRDNTHPFVLEKGHSAVMHNGIIQIPVVKGWSDTRTFARNVLAMLPPDWQNNSSIRWTVEQATLGSKLVIMYSDGSMTIIHRKAGLTEGGIWYSNDGFRPGIAKDEWVEAARAWEAKKREEAKREGAGAPSKVQRKGGEGKSIQYLPIQSTCLYRFEGVTICGWCLAREDDTDEAVLVSKPHEAEQCELCRHSPFITGSRDTRLATLGMESQLNMDSYK